MDEKDKIIEIGPKDMEKVSGGNPYVQNSEIIRECPNCGVYGPHNRYSAGRVCCNNCGYAYTE